MGQPADRPGSDPPQLPATPSRAPQLDSPPTVRVPGTSPRPLWRSGGGPPKDGGPSQIGPPRPPGRGREHGHLSLVAEPEEGNAPPWAVFVPRDARSVDLRRHSAAGRLRELAVVPSGSWVSILDDRPFSHWRLRRVASAVGLVVERELVVVRVAGATVVLDAAAPDGGLGLLGRSRTRWWARERVLLARRR